MHPEDRNAHRPRHLYADEALYAITVGVYKKQHLLNTVKKQIHLAHIIHTVLSEFSYKLYAWVVLTNHYHILTHSHKGKDLPLFLKKAHSKYALWLNKQDNMQGRKVFYQYWDEFFEGEAGFFRFMNYIHYNPVKHGYVKAMEQWRASSVHTYIRKRGARAVYGDFEHYPLGEWSLRYDDKL